MAKGSGTGGEGWASEAGCRQAVHLVCGQLGVAAGFVSFFDGETEWLVACQGVRPDRLPRPGALMDAEVRPDEVVEFEDLGADSRGEEIGRRYGLPGWGFAAAAPLADADGNLVGCLAVFDPQPRRLSPGGGALLIGVAGLLMAGPRGREPGGTLGGESAAGASNLLQSETYLLHTLMDHLPDAIYFKDRESRFVRVNRATARRHGWDDPAGAYGRTDFDVFAEEHARAAFEDERRILETGEPVVDKEEEETWPDGSVTWVSTTKLPLRDGQGRIIGTFGLSRDVTDRKQAQEAVVRHATELEAINSRHGAELTLASELQRAFLPEHYPEFPSPAGPDRSLLEFCHVYRPVEVVGGDYFAVTALGPQTAGALVCDVVGHGVRAALVTAMLNAVVKDLRESALDPARFLSLLNARLWASLGGRFEYGFVTAFYLVVDAAAHTVHFTGAGHPQPLLLRRRAGRVEPLAGESEMSGQALLLHPHPRYRTQTVGWAPGDGILLYTDGIYEVRNAKRVTYGAERMEALLASHLHESTPALLRRLLAEALAFSRDEEFQDDVCLLGIDLAGP